MVRINGKQIPSATIPIHADAALEPKILLGEHLTPRFGQWGIFIFHLPSGTLLRNKLAPAPDNKSDYMPRFAC